MMIYLVLLADQSALEFTMTCNVVPTTYASLDVECQSFPVMHAKGGGGGMNDLTTCTCS